MANKTTRWTGATDGDWDVAGNWDNGIPSTAAGDKDTVIVSRTAANAMTTNLDRTGDAAGAGLDLTLFYVEEGATLPVGTSGSPLTLTADKVVNRGTGLFSFLSKDGTGALTTSNVILDSDRTDSNAMVLDDANGATIDTFIGIKGMVNFKSSMTLLGHAYFGFRTSPSTDLIVNVETAASTLFTNVYMIGGRVTCGRNVSRFNVFGGHLTQNGTITTYEQSGGTVIHTDTTTISNMRLTGGTMDLRKLTGALTITNLYKLPGARMLYSKDLVTITNNFTDYKGE